MVEDFSKRDKPGDPPEETEKIHEFPADIAEEILEIIREEPPPIPTSEKKPQRPPRIPKEALRSVSDVFIVIEDRRRPNVNANASTNVYSKQIINEVYFKELSIQLKELICILLSERYAAVRIDEWNEKSKMRLQFTVLREHDKADAFVNEIALLCEMVKEMQLIIVNENNLETSGIESEDYEKNIVDEVENLYIFEIDFKNFLKRKKLREHIQHLVDRLKVLSLS